MKPITQIYSEYRLIPALQEHQLRVSAVAKQICESMAEPVDEESVIKTTLLHDMGNIIKSIFSIFPEFLAGKSVEYWQGVKDDYIAKYGDDEHHATAEIAKELNVDDKVLKLLGSVGFSKAIFNAKNGSLEAKICCYSDMRVGPYGILSLSERLAEGKKRYGNVGKSFIDPTVYDGIVKSVYEIEKQVFAHSKITPEQITNASITSNINFVSETLF